MASPGFEPIPIDEDPGTFHARPFDHVEQRTLWVPQLTTAQTLVLGSSQGLDTIDHDALTSRGIGLTTRRSGGGAVLVSSADLVWFDAVLPVSDPLWTADVSRSFDWLGRAIQSGLRALGVETERHEGSLQTSDWSSRVCFAGVGPGELTLSGKKLVGISQRRTRRASRFQVAILRRWDPQLHARVLVLDAEERRRAETDLSQAAVAIPNASDEIRNAVFAELERPIRDPSAP